jgi:alpha-D-ribose 1-methylphosphonate 5-triphosphate diphosphatase
MSGFVFTNARVVTGDRVLPGTVEVDDGRIRSVDEGRSGISGAVDLDGDFLIPGLVELHTDNVERHIMPRPAAPWPVAAAVVAHDREVASAGITTVFDSISVGEIHSRAGRAGMLADLCDEVDSRARRGDFTVDHFIHLRCELSYGDFEPIFAPLIDHERVGLVSLMDHTPGQRQFRDTSVYARYYQNKFAMSDDELAAFIEARRSDQVLYSRANRDLVVKAARERTIPIASHDDATSDHIGEAVEDGIVIAEFPTTVEAASEGRRHDLSVLMGAPNLVRGASHSGNVSARELAAEGLLDILSSDYLPAALLFGAFMLERICDHVTLPEAIATVTRTPAARVGLGDRGEIAVGKRADLVRVRDSGDVPLIRAVWRGGERVA